MNKNIGIDVDSLPEELRELIEQREKSQELAQKAQSWVSDYGVQESIKMFANNTDMNRPKLRLNYDISAGGGSYTDGQKVRLALPEAWFHREENDWVRFMKFVAAHELGHINWSDFDVFVNFQKRAESYFNKKHDIDGMGRFAGNMLNITEDGRIERAQANLMPGLRKYIQYVNGINYDEFPSEQLGIVPLHDFTNTSLMLSKTGLLPEGYKEKIDGTDTDKAIKKSMPLILKAIRAKTAQECADATWEILIENEEFLVEATKKIQMEQEELQRMLEEMDGNQDEQQDGDSEEGDGQGEGSQSEGSGENTEVGDGAGSSQENGEPSDSEKGSGSGRTISIDPLDNYDGEADYTNRPTMKETPDGDESTHFADEENLEEGESKEFSDESDDETTDSTTESESTDNSDNEEESNDSDKGDSSNSGDEQSNEDDTEDGIKSTLKGLKKETETDSVEFLNKAKEIAKRESKRISREKAERKETDVSPDVIQGALSEYSGGRGFRYVDEDFVDNGPIPEEITRTGRGLKRDLEEIFNDKRGWTLNNQRSGLLDESQLYRAGSGLRQNDVFIKRQIPEDSNWVVSVLVDNSGSMRGGVYDELNRHLGTKVQMAREATTTLEIALNGLVPLKITRFDLDSPTSSDQHAQVRGWEQKTKKILSWHSTDNTGYRNSDAMAIGVAVEELKNRPENKKLLIVLSDGLPSGNTPEQVKKVIDQSRADGVKIVGIGFGSNEELGINENIYRKMYDKDLVLTMPDQLSKELVKVLRSTIARG